MPGSVLLIVKFLQNGSIIKFKKMFVTPFWIVINKLKKLQLNRGGTFVTNENDSFLHSLVPKGLFQTTNKV